MIDPPPNSSARDAGFTLLELLVALAVLGLLSLVLFGSLSFGIQVWQRSEDALESANHVHNVEAALFRDVSRAYPLYALIAPGHAKIDFDGTEDSLIFLTPDDTLPGALDRVTIKQEASDDGTVVTRSSALELSAQAGTQDTVLFTHVGQLRFSYFGADASGKPSAWRDEWRDRTRPPSLIRIEIAFTNRPEGFWPGLVVAPRLSSDAGCVFDPLTKDCRGR